MNIQSARILFFKGGPGSGHHGHHGRPGRSGGSQLDPGIALIEASLRAHAAPWRHVEFSPEAWEAEFPNGQAHTPIGDIKLGENQRDKLSSREREHYFGLIKPTLEAPTYIVAEREPTETVQGRLARGESVERPSVFQFIRAFLQEDGRHQGFMCVTVSRDGLEILVSASPRKIARLARSIREGAILTVGSAVAGETASPGREDGLNKAVSYRYLTTWDAQSQQGIVVCGWALFKALAGFSPEEQPLLKRMATPTGARWITEQQKHDDCFKRQWMLANFGSGQKTIYGKDRPGDSERLPRMGREKGPLRLRKDLHITNQHGSFSASCILGIDEWPHSEQSVGDTAHLRQSRLCKSSASGLRDTDRQLQGHVRTGPDQGRCLGKTSQGQTNPNPSYRNSCAPSGGRILLLFGEKIWSGERPNFADLYGQGLAGTFNKDFTFAGIEPLFKRIATPTGARWITVRPNGADAKGVPIMIQESQSGSGVYHVVGGAGGKLNYLKLRGIKPESDYKKEAAEKRKIQQMQDRQRRDRDREAGLDTSKKAEKGKVAAAQRDQEKTFIAGVAQAAGWTEKDTQFDHEQYAHLSPRAYQEVRNQHHTQVLKQAKAFVSQQAAQLLADPEHLKQALGETPLTANDPTTLTVADIDPVKPADTGLGFAPAYGQRAGKPAVQAEAAEIKSERLAAHPEQQRALASRQETRAKLNEELANQRPPEPPPKPATQPLPVEKVMGLLKQQKQLGQATQAAQAARQKIDAATNLHEIKAYNIEVGKRPVEDDEIVQDLQDELRTMHTRALLGEIKKVSAGQNPEQALGRHIGAGAQAAVDALALTVAGHGLIDRSVVDVLGVEGAARAIANRLHATLDAGELDTLQQAMGDYHVDHYTQRGQAAMAEAQEYQDKAKQIELEAARTGGDLQNAQGLNRQRIQALAHARRVLGTCLGEFEMNGALVKALHEGRRSKPLEVALGKIGLESALAQAKAIGLQQGDYALETIGGNQFLTVRPEGLDRLTQPIDKERLTRQRTALDIIGGHRDEENWLPIGISDRPDLAAPTPPGVAPTLAETFSPSSAEDVPRALEDYIGGRTADGDAPADILADLLSSPMLEKAEAVGATREQVMATLQTLAPSRDAKGKMMRAEAHVARFQALADQFVQRRHGGDRSPLHRQHISTDDKAIESLHRALSAEPAGIAAFKAIGDLEDGDQRTLRAFFETHVAKDDPDAAAVRKTLTALEKQEPEKETVDMFGETSTNPAWQDWHNRRNELAEQLNAMTMDWPKYVKVMHGRKNAYAAMQDLIRGRVTTAFHDSYNTLNPATPLKLGRQVIRSNLNHLDAIDPDARAARLSQERKLIDSLRNRVGGKYAEGSVIEKIEATREQQEAMAQNQMGFFGATEEPADAQPAPLKADERHTLGHVAEQQIARMMGVVGKNFKPGQPIKLWNPSMSGKENIGRQRAVKLIEANKRVALSLGTGSGKTVIGLGAFTHLHAKEKVRRGIFAVPSIVQGQFGAEALRYIDPNRNYKWHAEPGASRDERIAALKDPKNHFVVTTHQALRDDLMHLGAQHEGITTEQLADRLDAQSPAERATWMKELMDREGIDSQYLMVDEGHNLLNRAGKDNSRMANVLDALSANTPYYVNATADSIKNDVSEAFDLLSKMDPAHYTDRSAFTRRFGVNTAAAKNALQRELAPYMITGRIESGQTVHRRTETVPLSAAQHQALKQTQGHLAKLRLARMQGRVDVAAAKALSPDSFAQAPTEQHEAIARKLSTSLGVIKESAINRILNAHPAGGKLDAIHRLTAPGGELHGQPGVIFAHSLDAVRHISERLSQAGHRVVSMTGADSSKVKAQKKAMFNPEAGPAQADILVTSDAGAVGMNAQRGRWLIQHDIPQTAMVHNQRNGRIDRIGQKNDVKLIDLIHDHPAEQAARDRLAKKYELREIMTAPQIGLDDSGLAGYLARRRATQATGDRAR